MSASGDVFDEMVGPEIPEEPDGGGEQPSEPAAPEAPAEPAPEAEEPAAPAEEPAPAETPDEEAPEGSPAGGEEPDAGAVAEAKTGNGGLPKSVIKELQKNRERVRDLQREIAEARALQNGTAVAPLPGQSPAGQPPQPGMPPQMPAPTQIPTVVGEDGKEYIEPQALEQYLQQREMASVPSPQEQIGQRLQQARLQFVGENPERNGPASQRVDSAVQMLDLLTDQATAALGYQTRDLTEWEAAIATTGGLMQFREAFPEISDPKRLAHAVIASRQGDVQSLRFWMDDYMQSGYGAFEAAVGLTESPAPPSGAAAVTQPSGGPAAAPEPAPSAALLAAKPRSMATKGAPTVGADEDLKSELASLERDIGNDPLGVGPNAETMHERAEEIRRKLGME